MGRADLPISVLVFASVTAASGLGAQTRADVSVGERIFSAQCARCHGMGGTGGEGPALQGRSFRTVKDEADIVGVILDGLGAMPGIWLGDTEAADVAAYVWSLARTETAPVPGDASAGRLLFEGKGTCITCHIVRGRGVGLGPELTDVGAKRGAEYLRRAIEAPGAELPMGQITPHASFLLVRGVDRDGNRFEGLRVWEDAFVIQIREAGGAYRHLAKSDMASFDRLFGASLMPDYARLLTGEEVTDLVAYLASLRGNP